MQSIKLLAREDTRTAAWQNLAVDQFNAGVRTQRLAILYQGLNGLLFGIENVVTIWLAALLVLDGKGFSVGMLFAFIAYKTQFVQRIANLIEKGLELRMLGLHTERVGDVALTPAEPTSVSLADRSGTGGRRDRGERAELPLRRIRAAGAERHRFARRAGESVAIVGPSGCGKTTLVKLLLGLLQPTQGASRSAACRCNGWASSATAPQVASVMQDDQLFAGSIAENVCFFDPQPDYPRIEQCARLAAVHDDILAMPMRYNTLVGDMGTVLSGGQKQRILLARALYRQPKHPGPGRGHQPPRHGARAQRQRGGARPQAHPHHRGASAGDDRQRRPHDCSGRAGASAPRCRCLRREASHV